jgi:hypothetical protein
MEAKQFRALLRESFQWRGIKYTPPCVVINHEAVQIDPFSLFTHVRRLGSAAELNEQQWTEVSTAMKLPAVAVRQLRVLWLRYCWLVDQNSLAREARALKCDQGHVIDADELGSIQNAHEMRETAPEEEEFHPSKRRRLRTRSGMQFAEDHEDETPRAFLGIAADFTRTQIPLHSTRIREHLLSENSNAERFLQALSSAEPRHVDWALSMAVVSTSKAEIVFAVSVFASLAETLQRIAAETERERNSSEAAALLYKLRRRQLSLIVRNFACVARNVSAMVQCNTLLQMLAGWLSDSDRVVQENALDALTQFTYALTLQDASELGMLRTLGELVCAGELQLPALRCIAHMASNQEHAALSRTLDEAFVIQLAELTLCDDERVAHALYLLSVLTDAEPANCALVAQQHGVLVNLVLLLRDQRSAQLRTMALSVLHHVRRTSEAHEILRPYEGLFVGLIASESKASARTELEHILSEIAK